MQRVWSTYLNAFDVSHGQVSNSAVSASGRESVSRTNASAISFVVATLNVFHKKTRHSFHAPPFTLDGQSFVRAISFVHFVNIHLLLPKGIVVPRLSYPTPTRPIQLRRLLDICSPTGTRNLTPPSLLLLSILLSHHIQIHHSSVIPLFPFPSTTSPQSSRTPSFTTASRTAAKFFSLDQSVVEDVRHFAAVRPVCQEMETRTMMIFRVVCLARRVVAHALASVGTDSNGHFSCPISL
jgi:hypothetical protein